MSMFEKIEADIKAAMLAKEKEKLEALRAVKAAFLLAKTEKGASETLSAEVELKIMQKLVKQRKETAEIYKANGREDLCAKEINEAAIIEQYLPKPLTDAEIEAEVKKIIDTVGAKGPQDMGKVMGVATKQMSGKADGKIISQKVKDILAAM